MTLFHSFCGDEAWRRNCCGVKYCEGLMRTDGVVDAFPVAEFAIELVHLQRARRGLVELLGVGAVGAFDRAVEFGECGGSTNRCRPRCWQACSNSAANSLPPSTCGREWERACGAAR